ncbi:MFS transporter [Enterobacter cloacae]|nr:MFS transporter [Enterobacter cloacae]
MMNKTKSDQKIKWYILSVIILMYLPVSLDATILHVAAPMLSIDLKASTDEVLWIIDIYSLVMASFLLPMGVVGDKIGAKKLAFTGIIIFGLASFIAMLSTTAMLLIIARGMLAIGAAMILPATLSALRITFSSNKERAIALGIWSAVGTGGAALGPLAGGLLLEKFSWGSVFFINIPVCILVLVMASRIPDLKAAGAERKIPVLDPLLLIASILLIILSVKAGAREGFSLQLMILPATGISLMAFFIRRQRTSENPMLQLSFFRNRTIVAGIILALASMISLVGFEFYVSQLLQLAYGKTPLQAGLFLMPLILASCLSGPFIGWALDRTGIRLIAVGGVAMSAASFAGMAFISFDTQIWNAWLLMVVLGFCIEAALLASTTAIMDAVPGNKAGEAGAIEGMAYELGAGLGVVFFGLLMSSTFRNNLSAMQPGYDNVNIIGVGSSLSEAFSYVANLPENQSSIVREASITAFLNSHSTVMLASSLCLTVLTVCIYFLMKERSLHR